MFSHISTSASDTITDLPLPNSSSHKMQIFFRLAQLLLLTVALAQVLASRPPSAKETAESDIIPFPKAEKAGSMPFPANFGPQTKSKSESKSSKTHARSGAALAYEPTWESLDSRPLPAWFDEAKVGIFIHWGVYSVPAISAWFWLYWKIDQRPDIMQFMYENYPPGFTYANFAPQLTAEFYNASAWVELFKQSGAKYVVLTSKHHEGYTLWPSSYSFNWNAKDVGPHRDLLGELATAVRSHSNLRFGLYYSLLEWFNPLFVADKASNLTTNDFVQFKMKPELYELVNKYQPEIMWGDGEWEAPDAYWGTTEFLAWLYNESPVQETVVVNDRWGDTLCKHGGFYTCADRYNPGVLQPQKWENAMTLDINSWGYKRISRISDYLTPHQLIRTLVETVACGGNILVNVGPTKDGSIVPIQEERLLQMGEWLTVNGEAIYRSDPWTAQNDTVTPGVWYTTSKDRSKVYAMLTGPWQWPADGVVQLGAVDEGVVGSMQMLGYAGTGTGTLGWSAASQGIRVTLPPLQSVNSKYAYTIVITTRSGSGGGGASPAAYAPKLILLALIFVLKYSL